MHHDGFIEVLCSLQLPRFFSLCSPREIQRLTTFGGDHDIGMSFQDRGLPNAAADLAAFEQSLEGLLGARRASGAPASQLCSAATGANSNPRKLPFANVYRWPSRTEEPSKFGAQNPPLAGSSP